MKGEGRQKTDDRISEFEIRDLDPSTSLPTANDPRQRNARAGSRSLSFDYTQDRFGTGQAGQVLCGAGMYCVWRIEYRV